MLRPARPSPACHVALSLPRPTPPDQAGPALSSHTAPRLAPTRRAYLVVSCLATPCLAYPVHACHVSSYPTFLGRAGPRLLDHPGHPDRALPDRARPCLHRLVMPSPTLALPCRRRPSPATPSPVLRRPRCVVPVHAVPHQALLHHSTPGLPCSRRASPDHSRTRLVGPCPACRVSAGHASSRLALPGRTSPATSCRGEPDPAIRASPGQLVERVVHRREHLRQLVELLVLRDETLHLGPGVT